MSLPKTIGFAILTGLATLFYCTALYDKVTRPAVKNLDGTGLAWTFRADPVVAQLINYQKKE